MEAIGTQGAVCYRIGERPIYLNSGEFHYFRVPKTDWRTRMRGMIHVPPISVEVFEV